MKVALRSILIFSHTYRTTIYVWMYCMFICCVWIAHIKIKTPSKRPIFDFEREKILICIKASDQIYRILNPAISIFSLCSVNFRIYIYICLFNRSFVRRSSVSYFVGIWLSIQLKLFQNNGVRNHETQVKVIERIDSTEMCTREAVCVCVFFCW